MIAFYYGLTGFACAWFYRRTMRNSARDTIMQGVLPVAGGVFLLGVGSLVLGLVLMAAWQIRRPEYFRGETLPRRDSSELILLDGAAAPGLRLPDSVENTVIAPDLSNLPPGATAVDVRTGEEVHLEQGQRYVDEGEAEQEARERSDDDG
jgi:hypothetical protein